MLFGKVAPTGKLPVTWPASATQEPINAGDGQTPLFALGAGLTWSTGGGDVTAPTTPTGLTVTGTTTTTASLTWTASTDAVGVTGYDVYRGSTRVGSATGTTFTDTGLTPGTAYAYTVRARDAAGNVSSSSAGVTATTAQPGDTSAPTVPTGLTAGTTTTSTVALTWTASTDDVGVAGYDVYRGTTRVATTTTTGYTDTGLTAGTAYTYTVRAKDAAGNVSAASSAVTATTQPGHVDPDDGVHGDLAHRQRLGQRVHGDRHGEEHGHRRRCAAGWSRGRGSTAPGCPAGGAPSSPAAAPRSPRRACPGTARSLPGPPRRSACRARATGSRRHRC